MGSLVDEVGADRCKLKNCFYLLRHNRDRKKSETFCEEKKVEDNEYLYYRDLLDTIHCHLHHLYDTGFRVKKKELIKNNNEQKLETEEKCQKTKDSYFSAAFSNL